MIELQGYRRRKLEKSTQCKLRLNVFMVLKFTSAGRLFHTFITRTQKKLLQIYRCNRTVNLQQAVTQDWNGAAQTWSVCNKRITQIYLPPTHEPFFVCTPCSCRASPPFDWYSSRLPTKGWPGWVVLGGWLHTYQNKCHAPGIKLFCVSKSI